MLSDEEKILTKKLRYCEQEYEQDGYLSVGKFEAIEKAVNLIEKQSKEIEELKETLKCTQNSWYEDTQKIEEMKKQIDLDSECEIALNNRIMDLENADKKWENKIKAKIEEVKDGTFDAKIVLQSLLEKE